MSLQPRAGTEGLQFRGAAMRQLKEGGGEDAFFMGCRDLGVFDGVGGRQTADVEEVNVREFTESLAEIMQRKTEEFGAENGRPPSETRLPEMLKEALREARNSGASTVALASIDAQRKLLQMFNVGDSGVVVLRPLRILHPRAHLVDMSALDSLYTVKAATVPMEQGFNCPVQLGKDRDGRNIFLPDEGVMTMVPLKEGDVIVAGTDGLFDNVPLWELLLSVEQTIGCGKSEKAAVKRLLKVTNRHMNSDNTVVPWGEQSHIASQLARRRHETLPAHQDISDRELVEYSQLHSAWAPYFKTGREHYVGGKLDDVTIVVASVVSTPLDT